MKVIKNTGSTLLCLRLSGGKSLHLAPRQTEEINDADLKVPDISKRLGKGLKVVEPRTAPPAAPKKKKVERPLDHKAVKPLAESGKGAD